ncbi:MAG TPA: outer membrane protein assembly factor BamE [Thermoanaerobaculia bacterium]|nr:outer membrane protein assembly factor BamE [Thermoanaerobaculia bacterium]
MHRSLGAALLSASLLIAPACGPSAEQGAARPSPAADAEWTWLQQAKVTLDGQRSKLAAAGAADPGLARETEALAGELNRRLVELLNADPPIQGEPLSERQQAAVRMKSDEDILLARQFIDQGGDYQRAIDIYREALVVDPGNPRLQQELAKARSRRYVTREAFAQIKEGMEREEVRRLLGQPNLHSVRDYPDRGVVGWFYPKDASGAAAAVWFHQEGGRATVYLLDFDALQPHTPAEPAEPPRAPQSAT